jgi:hypothetical protein
MLRKVWILPLVLLPFVAGCASGGLTTREAGALTGAGLGTGAGYIVGHVLGQPTLGAIAGGLAGGTAGAVVGDRLDARKQERERAAAAALAAASAQRAPAAMTMSMPTGDPTAGVFVNSTLWTVALVVAPAGDTSRPATITLAPNAAVPHALDIGTYRVTGTATVPTQFGPRPVGSVERLFSIDPRSQGWHVELKAHDFK